MVFTFTLHYELSSDESDIDVLVERLAGMRPAKSSTRPRKARTWCALKFKWTPVLAF